MVEEQKFQIGDCVFQKNDPTQQMKIIKRWHGGISWEYVCVFENEKNPKKEHIFKEDQLIPCKKHSKNLTMKDSSYIGKKKVSESTPSTTIFTIKLPDK